MNSGVFRTVTVVCLLIALALPVTGFFPLWPVVSISLAGVAAVAFLIARAIDQRMAKRDEMKARHGWPQR